MIVANGWKKLRSTRLGLWGTARPKCLPGWGRGFESAAGTPAELTEGKTNRKQNHEKEEQKPEADQKKKGRKLRKILVMEEQD